MMMRRGCGASSIFAAAVSTGPVTTAGRLVRSTESPTCFRSAVIDASSTPGTSSPVAAPAKKQTNACFASDLVFAAPEGSSHAPFTQIRGSRQSVSFVHCANVWTVRLPKTTTRSAILDMAVSFRLSARTEQRAIVNPLHIGALLSQCIAESDFHIFHELTKLVF